MKRLRLISVVLVLLVLLVVVTAVYATRHLVSEGENLFRIAQQYGVSPEAIMDENPQIVDPDLIYAGDTLEIPDSEGGASTTRFYEEALLPPPPVTTSFGVGAEIYDFKNEAWMQQLGMTWTKIVFRWTPGDSPGLLAGDIQRAHDNQLKILVSISGEDTYPLPGTIAFTRYVDFIRGVAELEPDAIEIWNEMNLYKEWPDGEIDPESYVEEMLKPTYEAIKRVDHDIVVIAGGLSPTGYHPSNYVMDDGVYLAGLAQAGAINYMDCIGVHFKTGATPPEAVEGHPADTQHPSWYFTKTLDRYQNAFGGLRPLCITELGYLADNGTGGLPGEFSWGDENKLEQQGIRLAQAIEIAQNDYKVDVVIIYNLDYSQMGNTEPDAAYAIVRQDGTCPACPFIADAINRLLD